MLLRSISFSPCAIRLPASCCRIGQAVPSPPIGGHPDPVKLQCEEWERRKELGAMLAGLERQLRAFIQLPFCSLDDISLRAHLRELGQGVDAS
jgi:hypothetical protein